MNGMYITGASLHHVTASHADHLYPGVLSQGGHSTVPQDPLIHHRVGDYSPRPLTGIRAKINQPFHAFTEIDCYHIDEELATNIIGFFFLEALL